MGRIMRSFTAIVILVSALGIAPGRASAGSHNGECGVGIPGTPGTIAYDWPGTVCATIWLYNNLGVNITRNYDGYSGYCTVNLVGANSGSIYDSTDIAPGDGDFLDAQVGASGDQYKYYIEVYCYNSQPVFPSYYFDWVD